MAASGSGSAFPVETVEPFHVSKVTITNDKPKKTKRQPYDLHQTFVVEGKAFQLTFVRGNDTSRTTHYKSADGQTTMDLPEGLLDQYRAKINFFSVQNFTAARIQGPDGLDQWGVGFCSHSEYKGYRRDKGHRRALTNALQQANVPRPIRSALWDAYNLHNPPPYNAKKDMTDDVKDVSDILTIAAVSILEFQTILKRRLIGSAPEVQAVIHSLLQNLGK